LVNGLLPALCGSLLGLDIQEQVTLWMVIGITTLKQLANNSTQKAQLNIMTFTPPKDNGIMYGH